MLQRRKNGRYPFLNNLELHSVSKVDRLLASVKTIKVNEVSDTMIGQNDNAKYTKIVLPLQRSKQRTCKQTLGLRNHPASEGRSRMLPY